jgi:hypothetical protein
MTMDQYQRELRRAAAQAFNESLEQLATCFEPGVTSKQQAQSAQGSDDPPLHPPASGEVLSFKALEEANTDIEQFLRSRSEQSAAS